MTISDALGSFVADTSYADLPVEVVACAKRLIVDTLAVAWAGTASDGSSEMFDLVSDEGGRQESALWGFGRGATATQAAFVNGVTSAGISSYDVATT